MPPKIVRQLREAVQASGQSLNQLSQACGVDRGRLSRFLRGERDLTLAAAGQLCDALGLQLCRRDDGTPMPLKEDRSRRRPRKGK